MSQKASGALAVALKSTSCDGSSHNTLAVVRPLEVSPEELHHLTMASGWCGCLHPQDIWAGTLTLAQPHSCTSLRHYHLPCCKRQQRL